VKTCRYCGLQKSLTEFYERKSSVDGYRHDCKECVKNRSKAYAINNKEKVRQQAQERYRKKIEENPTYHKDKYWTDLEKAKKNNQINYLRHREKRIESAVQWAKENKHMASANKAAYKAAKKNATPPWLNEDDFWMMKQAYELAKDRSDIMGFAWHVDHVVPLRGENFSGLHVPWNLQVIPGSLNCSKQNRLEM